MTYVFMSSVFMTNDVMTNTVAPKNMSSGLEVKNMFFCNNEWLINVPKNDIFLLKSNLTVGGVIGSQLT